MGLSVDVVAIDVADDGKLRTMSEFAEQVLGPALRSLSAEIGAQMRAVTKTVDGVAIVSVEIEKLCVERIVA